MTKKEATKNLDSIKILLERGLGKGVREVDFRIRHSELGKESIFVSAKELVEDLLSRQENCQVSKPHHLIHES